MTAANLARAFVDQAAARPGLVVGTVDDQVTLDEAVRMAAGRAQSLAASGIASGERVALVGDNSTDYIVTWLACVFLGAPVALVNPSYPEDLVDRMLKPVAPTRVLREADIAVARTSGTADPEMLPGVRAGLGAPVSFMHTSGTTGLPKFCIQTHEYFLNLARSMAEVLDLRDGDRVLAPLPYFHINPLGYGLIAGILAGADVLTLRKFSARAFWPDVIEHRITVMILHAPPVEILKRATTPETANGHTVRTMFFADGEFMHTFKIPEAVSGYGSTEAGGISHLRRWRSTDDIPVDASRHGGYPRDGLEWRLSSEGEIQIRETEPNTLFGGYLTGEAVTTARDEEGWFETGDLGESRSDGYLVFLERAAESIRVKGEFVPIPFVENHLAGVSGLRDHAIWKRKGELVDEEVVLYVVTDDAVPVEALRSRAADLPAFMRPVAFARVESLPRDEAVGKVRRRLLGDLPVLEWSEASGA